MQRFFAWAVLLIAIASIPAIAQTTEQKPSLYDGFDRSELTLWDTDSSVTKVDEQTLVIRQRARFKRLPLLSKQVFDLDLASQQNPIDMTIKLGTVKGSRTNVQEYNNFEFGWADEQGKLIFGWRWEFISEGKNQAHRMFNSQSWSSFWGIKPPKTLFTQGDIIGLRVTDATVQMLCNGKVVRSVGRPADLKNTEKCRIYISFIGPADGATVSLDDVQTTGVK